LRGEITRVAIVVVVTTVVVLAVTGVIAERAQASERKP
jgi:hypothetical protein